MPKFQVHVIQTYRVYAETTMEVEADSQDEANELVDQGEIDKPFLEHWEKSWELMSEEVSTP